MEAELPRDFKEFLRLLRSHGVEYLLIAGYAVIYHGFPRATGDMGIWIAMDPENARRMVDTVREFGFNTPDLTPALVRRMVYGKRKCHSCPTLEAARYMA